MINKNMIGKFIDNPYATGKSDVDTDGSVYWESYLDLKRKHKDLMNKTQKKGCQTSECIRKRVYVYVRNENER